jgi:hypothetical protein
MKTLFIKSPQLNAIGLRIQPLVLAAGLLFIWFYLPPVLRYLTPTAALIDAGIWQVLLLAVICHLVLLFGSWWLLAHVWQKLGLTPLNLMVSHFNALSLWQRLRFYWASFALVVLAGIACLIALL